MNIENIINKEKQFVIAPLLRSKVKDFLTRYLPAGERRSDLPERNQLKWLEGEFKSIGGSEDINLLINKIYQRSLNDGFHKYWKTMVNCEEDSGMRKMEFYKLLMVLLAQLKLQIEREQWPIHVVTEGFLTYLDDINLKREVE